MSNARSIWYRCTPYYLPIGGFQFFCWWISASRILICIRYVYTLKKMLKKQERRICWRKKKNNGSAFALGRGAPQMWIRNQTLMNLIFNEIAIILIEFPFYPTQKYLGEQCWRYKRILLTYWDVVISVTSFSCDLISDTISKAQR